MSSRYDFIIIGAGITGASTAYHLKKLGMKRVLLFERSKPAAGGTGRSAAVIRQHYSTALLSLLTKESIGMLSAMPDEIGVSGGYVKSGWMFLISADMMEGARKNIAMQQGCGINTRFLDEAEIAGHAPWLNPEGVAAVAYEKDGGYADPVQATEAYVKGFVDLGGEVRTNTPVRELTRDGERITGVVTDDGPIEADLVVNAAGPWAKPLAASANIEMELSVVREQDTVWEARPNGPVPEVAVSNGVDAIYVRPLGDRRFVVGRGYPKEYFPVDPYNYKETADEDFVSDVITRLEHRFPPMAGAKLIDSYAALYDVTPDWYPFIGPRSGLAGYADACGGSGHGFKIGPAIGRYLARWISDGTVEDDFAKLSYDRLESGWKFVGAYGGNRA
jgi:glycine/D-amino acid oxidase-like deaminating enzyme